MTQQFPNDNLDELPGFDPLQEAEIMTGRSYKHDEATSSIGLLLAVDNNQKKKELLKTNKDSYYGMEFAEFVVLMDSMGFKSVASGFIPNSEDEWFIDWKDGILVVYDSFRGSLNGAKAFFNYLPASDNSYGGGFSGTAVEGPNGKYVWCGNFDAREGFKHRLDNYRGAGIFMKKNGSNNLSFGCSTMGTRKLLDMTLMKLTNKESPCFPQKFKKLFAVRAVNRT
jgi:hypothetical protein